MKQILLICLYASLAACLVQAQSFSSKPDTLSFWKTGGKSEVSYNISCNVRGIYSDSTYVYVKTNSVPCHSIGPWKRNPNSPSAQDTIVRIPRYPSYSTSSSSIGRGPIAVFANGVFAYNFWDAQNQSSYWMRNAYYWEGASFDSCLGHPDGRGSYHNHVNPKCMYNSTDSTKHSPLIGFAPDGFPIYGPFCYSNANDTSSAVKRCVPCYQTKTYTNNVRTKLRDGSTAGTSLNVDSSNPLGSILDDYECTNKNADLDQYNGRYTKTKEFPNGIYAYFVTTGTDNAPLFPYIFGWSFKGTVPRGPFTLTSLPSGVTTIYSV